MEPMKRSRTIGFAVTAFCLMAMMVAAVSAVDTSGLVKPGGQEQGNVWNIDEGTASNAGSNTPLGQGPGQGQKPGNPGNTTQPGQGPGQGQKPGNPGNTTQPGQGPGQGQKPGNPGNTTQPGQGPGQGQKPGNPGNTTQPGQGPGQGQKPGNPGNTTPPGPGPGNQVYNISQTLSDEAQLNTLAFDALAFMTGDACSDTFLPPGKVADYAGFQYLRDNDATQMGHNTDFVTRTADNVLITLNDEQLAQYVALSKEESSLSDKYAYMRFPLMKAFRLQLDGTLPGGSDELDKASVMAYSGKLYDVDASISLERAKTYASVINSLNQTQRAYLDKMKSGGLLSYPIVDASEVLKNSGQGNSVAMRTYASEMFAWYAGSVEADVYFCPERQATYFGSFYMKDRPAMGNPNYSISTTLTGDSGEEFLRILTDVQRQKIRSLVNLSREDLREIVTTREKIATELRRPLTGGTIDETAIRTLSERYGELDGEISYNYATHFADVRKTLTSEQKQNMIVLRNLSGYTCGGVYLYSQPVSMLQNIPSDFLFGVGTYNATELSAWIQSQQQTITPGGKDPGNEQERSMPVEEIIAQLEQKGYDVSETKTAVQSGDRETVKVWLDAFKKNNPGIVETIEKAWTGNIQGGKGGSGTSNTSETRRGKEQPAQKSTLDALKNWFSNI